MQRIICTGQRKFVIYSNSRENPFRIKFRFNFKKRSSGEVRVDFVTVSAMFPTANAIFLNLKKAANKLG